MAGRNYLEELIIRSKPICCEKCYGKIFYFEDGKYQCGMCDHITMDDYGKVKEYMEEKGGASARQISQATGVDHRIIELLLIQGKMEISEDSDYYKECEKCGCSVRNGRYCNFCVRELAGGIHSLIKSSMARNAIPQYSMTGRMRYVSCRK